MYEYGVHVRNPGIEKYINTPTFDVIILLCKIFFVNKYKS